MGLALLMSELCEAGVKLLWHQCDPGRYPQGLQYIKQAVSEGDPEAYYFLHRCYAWEEGGVQGDEAKAYDLAKQGAALGSCRCVLGADRMNKLDAGFKAAAKYTLEEAFRQVRLAADQGEPFAAYQIGCAYYWGDVAAMEGVQPQDFSRTEPKYQAEAVRFYEKGAQGGVIGSMRNLAVCLENGEGVPKDQDRADQWWLRLAEMGNADGEFNTGAAEHRRKNYGAAMDYYVRAMEKGHRFAPFYLGKLYEFGLGTAQNYELAAKYYRMAADLGTASAQYYLGNLYVDGRGVPKDYAQAMHWFDLGAKQGNLDCICNIGWLYDNGYGCTQDFLMARKMYEIAAKTETDGYAHYRLGRLSEYGRGVDQDYEKAVDYYTKAAAMGSKDAKERLGHFKKNLFGRWKKTK